MLDIKPKPGIIFPKKVFWAVIVLETQKLCYPQIEIFIKSIKALLLASNALNYEAGIWLYQIPFRQVKTRKQKITSQAIALVMAGLVLVKLKSGTCLLLDLLECLDVINVVVASLLSYIRFEAFSSNWYLGQICNIQYPVVVGRMDQRLIKLTFTKILSFDFSYIELKVLVVSIFHFEFQF